MVEGRQQERLVRAHTERESHSDHIQSITLIY